MFNIKKLISNFLAELPGLEQEILVSDNPPDITLLLERVEAQLPPKLRVIFQDVKKDPSRIKIHLFKAAATDVAGSCILKPEFLWSRRHYEEIARLSNKLAKEFPDTRFVGIGNSPSYVIYGVETFSQQQRLNLETTYVPFSDRYMKRYDDFHETEELENARNRFKVDEKYALYDAVKSNAAFYRSFLKNLGLHPQKIVADHRESGRKTGFMDVVQSATSYASFLHFMLVWAKDARVNPKHFIEAIDCIALAVHQLHPKFSFPSEKIILNVHWIPISEDLKKVLNGNLSSDNDRFMPYYNAFQWDKAPAALPDSNALVVKQIKERIENSLLGKTNDRPLRLGPENTEQGLRESYIQEVQEAVYLSYRARAEKDFNVAQDAKTRHDTKRKKPNRVRKQSKAEKRRIAEEMRNRAAESKGEVGEALLASAQPVSSGILSLTAPSSLGELLGSNRPEQQPFPSSNEPDLGVISEPAPTQSIAEIHIGVPDVSSPAEVEVILTPTPVQASPKGNKVKKVQALTKAERLAFAEDARAASATRDKAVDKQTFVDGQPLNPDATSLEAPGTLPKIREPDSSQPEVFVPNAATVQLTAAAPESISLEEEEQSVDIKREMRLATVRLVKAFKAMEQELTRNHQRLFVRAHGVIRHGVPVPLEDIKIKAFDTREDMRRSLSQTMAYLHTAADNPPHVVFSDEAIVTALRVFENASGLDHALTNEWLRTGDFEMAAAETNRSVQTIKDARKRVLTSVMRSLAAAAAK